MYRYNILENHSLPNNFFEMAWWDGAQWRIMGGGGLSKMILFHKPLIYVK